MRSSARNMARQRGEYAAELYPVIILDNPYDHPVLAGIWEKAREKRIANPTPEYLAKCQRMLEILGQEES